MRFLLICAVFATICVVSKVHGLKADGSCPVSSSMTTCTPKCKDDSECFGRKCCPNVCNTKSCVPANQQSNTREGYKNQQSSTATGSYCGNVKCNSYEKCELDRSTNRQRCVRH